MKPEEAIAMKSKMDTYKMLTFNIDSLNDIIVRMQCIIKGEPTEPTTEPTQKIEPKLLQSLVLKPLFKEAHTFLGIKETGITDKKVCEALLPLFEETVTNNKEALEKL